MPNVTQTFEQPSKKAGSEIGSLRNDLNRFARSPFGGSFVIFTPERYKEWKSLSFHVNLYSVSQKLPP